MSSDPRRLTQGLVLAGLLAASLGCGKQGPPLPPLRAIPAPTKDLHLRQQGMRVLLELTYPKTSAGGHTLDGISAVEVWETVQPAPPQGKPVPLDVKAFTPHAKKIFQVADAEVGAATFGDQLIFSMPLPDNATTPVAPPAEKTPAAKPATPAPTPVPSAPTTAPAAPPAPPPAPRPPARYYAVKTVSKSGEHSDFSNLVSLIPKVPPKSPDQLTTTPRPNGVLLEWSPVDGVLGYAIYRREIHEKTYGQPIHAPGPGDKSWLDNTARFGQTYNYAVTTFNDRDPFIESTISLTKEVSYQDRFPPPPPTELVGLGETGRVRLVWKASEAEDLAGYIVYRRGPQGEFVRVTAQPLPAAEYVDMAVKAGETYNYRVTAIDQAGNESAPGGEVRVSMP